MFCPLLWSCGSCSNSSSFSFNKGSVAKKKHLVFLEFWTRRSDTIANKRTQKGTEKKCLGVLYEKKCPIFFESDSSNTTVFQIKRIKCRGASFSSRMNKLCMHTRFLIFLFYFFFAFQLNILLSFKKGDLPLKTNLKVWYYKS